MKKKLILSFVFIIATCSVTYLFAWGIWGHKHINKAAVFALPEPLRVFFYNHIDFITEESVVPDIRKYGLGYKEEFPRHYINLEAYGITIDSLPRTMADARMQLDSAQMQRKGILPWYIPVVMDKLTKAFKDRDKTAILFYAADLAHYIGDAHMPLHTTIYHNGRKGQEGIHGFWESQLPEQLGDSYNFYTGDAKYISDVVGETWKIIKNTNSLVDSTLDIEQKLHDSFPKDKVFAMNGDSILRNKYNNPVHTPEYTLAYNKALNNMVEKQLRKSIAAVADYWYTAWVNAGKPDVLSLDSDELTKQNHANYIKELTDWKNGKVNYLDNEREF